jgi:protein-tyrosine-phosphatase
MRVALRRTTDNDEMTTVLFVCTGNICRSPLAAGLLAARLESSDPAIRVDSAGILDLKVPSPPEVIATGNDLGIDLANHRGRLLTVGDVEEAGLIIGMTRKHVREVVMMDPSAWARTFTFRELVRRGQMMRPRDASQSLEEWLVFVQHGRRMVDLQGKSKEDDIADPLGGSLRGYRVAAETIAGLVDDLVSLAWPRPPGAEGQ